MIDFKFFEAAFQAHFQTPSQLTISSPGRINLIGEHTDYNNGFVLPAAIDKSANIFISKRDDDIISLYAHDLKEAHETSLYTLETTDKGWPNYILGVVVELLEKDYQLQGFNALLVGDVPLGAGLSSSAAVECATVFALNEIFGLGIERVPMVQIAQKAENNFVGVKCGIMDQFASMMGKENHVIKLDCQSLEYEYFPLVLDGYKVVLMDTQVKHSLASSEYNTRRLECIAGVEQIQQKYPQVKTLRDATLDMLNECVADKTSKVYDRCLFVIEEIQRLQDACTLLLANDLQGFGAKMYATHDGLSKLYEVSCKELDFIAEACKKESAVLGARMMGGGFGGCVIALVKNEAVDSITQRIAAEYEAAMQLKMKVYITQIKDGTRIINN